MTDRDTDILTAAEATFTGVVRDPSRYAAAAAEILAVARSVDEPEALVVALHAHAWARHSFLDNLGAKKILDEAVRVAEHHCGGTRLGEVLVSRGVALQLLDARPHAFGVLRGDLRSRESTQAFGFR